MADIILVNPKIGIYNKVFKPFLPLSLIAVATFPFYEGYKIKIIDQHIDKKWEDTLKASLKDKPLLVGVTSMTGSQLQGAIKASKLVKKYNPSVPVVWGGVHSTLFTKQTIINDFIDIIVKGEGEKTFQELVHALESKSDLSKVIGIVYKKNGKIIDTGFREFLDLNTLPIPPYQLINVRDYVHTYFYEKEVVEIETSRGCPFSCAFCYNKVFNKRIWRAKNAEKTFELMMFLYENYNINSILIIDDSFFISVPRVNKLAKLIKNSPVDFKWGFQGRLQGILKMTKSELETLVESGCKFLQFGVESGSPRILKLINKKITIEEVIRANRILANYPEMASFYNFIVGFPTETKEDMMMTVDLAWRLIEENPSAHIGTIHIYKEYPGTPLYEKALEDGFRPPQTLEEWANYDWQSAVKRDKSPELMKLVKRISVASYCLDDKIEMLGDSKLASIIAKMYRPISRFRFKHKFFKFMPETIFFK